MKIAKLARLLILPLILLLSCSLSIFAFTSQPVNADDIQSICDFDLDDVPQAIKDSSGCSEDSENSKNKLSNTIAGIVQGVIAVVGFVAVAFIVYAGIQYMTASGDPQKVQKAKNTIFYSCIGLAICALAFGIVSYVTTSIIGADYVTDVGGGDSFLANVVSIINGVIMVLGFVCVGVVLYGGVNYMTSSGDAQKAQKARNVILYGAIGLIICVLSFAIVSFVINNISGGVEESDADTTSPDTTVVCEEGKTWNPVTKSCE